jgi:hypothetical protein
MVTWNESRRADLPQRALEDCFKPPDEPVRVRCLHCGQEYDSDAIDWRDDCGMWCCPVPDCGGAGFGFDIFPVDDDFWSDEPEAFDDLDELDDTGGPNAPGEPGRPDDGIPW